MIDFDLSIWLFFMLIWFVLSMVLKLKYKKDYTYIFFFTIFYVYICNVIKYTQFPIMVNEFMKEQIGQQIFTQANWIPLITLRMEDISLSMLNIVLTIPFGFGLPFLIKVNLKKSFVFGLLLSISLEFTQLCVAMLVGFSMRYLDINDIIFNVFGVIIGFFLYKGFRFLLKWLIQQFSIKSNVLLDFLIK